MNQKDIIQRFLFENTNIRGEIVNLTESYQTIGKQHTYPSFIKNILGESLVAVTLMSAILKFKGRLTLQFQGKDPFKLLLAQSTNDFGIRALAQFTETLEEKDMLESLKNGILGIIISPDTSTGRYQGAVNWEGNSLATSLEGYFKTSEQLPTRIWLAANETCATGLLLQPLPQESQSLSENIDWERIVHLTNTLTSDELLSLDPTSILHRLYSQEQVRVFQPEKVKFICNCSVTRSEQAVLMLGQEEAEEELAEKQNLVVTCEFCNTEYPFDRNDVERIFKEAK